MTNKLTQLTRKRNFLHKTKSRNRGITLIELAIALLVIGIIMAIVYGSLDTSVLDSAKKLAVKNQARQLPLQLERYEFENPPLEDGTSLMVLAEKNPDNPGFRPLKKETIMDPWNRPYFICVNLDGFKGICSYGQDGQPGGEGVNQDFNLTEEETWPTWLQAKQKNQD